MPAMAAQGEPLPPSVLDTSPHLAHYIFKLVLTNAASPSTAHRHPPGQHPLSVSSSGESDDESEGTSSPPHSAPTDASSSDNRSTTSSSLDDPSHQVTHNLPANREDREELVRKIIGLLDNEQEENVKDILRPYMGVLGKDEIIMDQVALDCMHRHQDDVNGVPYQAGSFTPTRGLRRPFTPTGVGSLRVRTPLARPHSPATVPQPGSGAATPTSTVGSHGLSGLGRIDSAPSPTASLTNLAPGAPAAPSSSSGYSSAGSPVPSPRATLNIKAAAFNPSVTSGLSSGRNPSSPLTPFNPSDPWRDANSDPPRAASPFTLASQGMVRTASNRIIAAPIISDPSSPFHSPMGTPTRPQIGRTSDVFGSSSASVNPPSRQNSTRGVVPDDDDDDEFSPFGSAVPKLHHEGPPRGGTPNPNPYAQPFEPFGQNHHDYASNSSGPKLAATSYDSRGSAEPAEEDPTNAAAGMTPLDVLSSVFSTVPRRDLEDALHRAGYDFEAAMAMLVAQFTHPRSGASTPNRIASPRPLIGIDGRGGANHHAPGPGYFQQGGRNMAMNHQFGGNRNAGPTRMCRYFLNGECRRSDCRFSHDLERALCRFWLRGHCAKGPNCEFMHQLPNNMDPQSLNSSMSRLDTNSPGTSHPGTPPVGGHYGAADDFPDLLAARLNRMGRFDPSRNRFANAVKRPVPPPPLPQIYAVGSAARHAPANVPSGGGAFQPPPERSSTPQPAAPAVPRPSQRVKLHASTLMPTLLTGLVANDQYMTARQNAIRLGHARNACLARAADAFRRGDGAAAKRFSREGKALNEKMLTESSQAAEVLVKDRMTAAQKTVRERDPSWSDDPRDHAERGRSCGAGLGVVLGVASPNKVPGGSKLSPEERIECMLDLHTLHGNEGADIASHFLAELERENYRGLAYIVVGEEKHVGTQDPLRGASKVRLAASVKQFLAEWGYAWGEHNGALCVDPCR